MKIVFFYFFALNFSSIFFNKCSGDLIAVETGTLTTGFPLKRSVPETATSVANKTQSAS